MVRLEDILEEVSAYNPSADLDIIKKAYVFSGMVHQGQVRSSGEPYLRHPLEVARILTELKMDASVVATGLLHDTVEDTHTTIERPPAFSTIRLKTLTQQLKRSKRPSEARLRVSLTGLLR
jgi:(p)ppGpp synthase/HD superfamily hydrolase